MAKIVTKKEYRKRRLKFQIAAGLVDFLVTLLCILLSVACIVSLVALLRWLRGDVPVSFGVFFDILKRVLKVNG